MRLTLGTANFLKNYSLIQKNNLNFLYKNTAPPILIKLKDINIPIVSQEVSSKNPSCISGCL